jgi:ferrous iron transport protein B
MGLTPGTRIAVTKIAPFGDPVELSVRGYELSVRREDLRRIVIADEVPERVRRAGDYYGAPHRRVPDAETARRMLLAHEHEIDAHRRDYDRSAHDRRTMRIALVGNPNSGKTTLFNALTGSNQYVGNWPGVTVGKKEGTVRHGGHAITVVDLPGVYSLSPYSQEEIVARDFIIGSPQSEPPDAVINIVDVTNLERNLYLTAQLLELERPMVVALNFMDELRASGGEIDARVLSAALGIPVVPVSARSGENLAELLRTAHRVMHTGYTLEPDDLYDGYTHMIHHRIDGLIHDKAYAAGLPAHWVSIKLLEGDAVVEAALGLSDADKAAILAVAAEYETAGTGQRDRETLVADSRYRFIEEAARTALTKPGSRRAGTRSDKIDKIVTHRLFAVPLFLLMMFLMFNLTFGPVGSFLSDGVGLGAEKLGEAARSLSGTPGVAVWLTSLLADGVIAGVGGVLTFLPQIALLFVCMSVLEDTGYMARAAFIMDRLLRRFGLSGKAFIPMLMGFGCSVPAIMGARTMESDKDRRMTVMLIPFMSCSAKLPVYGLIAAAFFGRYAGIAVFALYVLGMLLGIMSGVLFKNTVFRGKPAAFVMELPPYRMPKLRDTARHVWERVRGFIVRAGTLILLMSVILWFLQSFTKGFQMTGDASESIMAAIGRGIAPVFEPLGFGTWQASVALLTGFIAKEAVVATMAMFYNFPLTADSAAVAAAIGFSPAAAFAFLVFVLLYVPCVAAMAAVYREMNSLKWTAALAVWQTVLAWCAGCATFFIARLII